MATFDRRLVGYVTDGEPAVGQLVEILCQDHVGTYALPFLCRFEDGVWMSEVGSAIDARVLGWRVPKRRPWIR